MEKLIVQPGSRSKMEGEDSEIATIKNPETIRRIEAYESGATKLIPARLKELDKMLNT